MRFLLNDREVQTGLPRGLPVLDFLRRELRLTGTKEACREGDCGSCLVLLGELEDGSPLATRRSPLAPLRYRAVTSCLLPLAEVEGKHLVTIEGLGGADLTPVQQVMLDEGAVQCGFCTPGIVIALTGFFLASADLSADDALAAVEGNLCRCTGYAAIRRALERLASGYRQRLAGASRLDGLIRERIVPLYFGDIAAKLKALPARPPATPLRPGQLVLAGGTDLYVQRPNEMPEADPFLLSGAGLAEIRETDGFLVLGAATSVEAIRTSPLVAAAVPGIAEHLRLVCSQPVRERATVGGNVVNASPIGDLSVILLALDAEVGLANGGAPRVVPLASFFRGYKRLDLEPGELLRWVRFRPLDSATRFGFEKVARRTYLDIAAVNSAASVTLDGNRIVAASVSAGGVAPIPLHLARTSEYLAGREASDATVRQATAIADSEISPISDVRGSAEYRRLLLRQLICAHFHTLCGTQEGLP